MDEILLKEQLKELEKLSGLMSTFVRMQGATGGLAVNAGQEQRLRKRLEAELLELGANARESSSWLHKLSTAANNATGGLIAAFGIGGAFGYLTDWVDTSYTSFRDFVTVGQTFNSSLIEMRDVANKAGIELDHFSLAVQRGSTSVAVLGVERFAELSRAVKEGSLSFGSFGLTTREMTDYFVEYLDIQRASGQLDKISRMQVTTGFNQMVQSSINFAAATGKARDEILKLSIQTQKTTPEFHSFLASIPQDMRAQVQQALSKATTAIAALPEGMSDLLKRGLATSLTMGSAVYEEEVAKLGQFIPGLVQGIDKMGQAIRKGVDPMEAFAKSVGSIKNLTDMQKAELGVYIKTHAEARKVLELAMEAQGTNIDAFMKSGEGLEGFVKFLSNFNHVVELISSDIRQIGTGILRPFITDFEKSKIFDLLNDFSVYFAGENSPIKMFSEQLGIASSALKTQLDPLFSEMGSWLDSGKTMDLLKSSLAELATYLKNAAVGILKWAGVFNSEGQLNTLETIINDWQKNWKDKLWGLLGSIGNSSVSFASWMGKQLRDLVGAAFGDDAIKIFNNMKSVVGDIFKALSTIPIGAITKSVFEQIGKITTALADIPIGEIARNLMDQFNQITTALSEIPIGEIMAQTFTEFKKLVDWMANTDFVGALTNTFNSIVIAFAGIANKIPESLGGMTDEVYGKIMEDFGGYQKDAANSMDKVIKSLTDQKNFENKNFLGYNAAFGSNFNKDEQGKVAVALQEYKEALAKLKESERIEAQKQFEVLEKIYKEMRDGNVITAQAAKAQIEQQIETNKSIKAKTPSMPTSSGYPSEAY